MTTPRAALLTLLLTLGAAPAAAQEKRPLDHTDFDTWNRIQNDVVSADGRWLVYRLVPGDGDAIMIVRSLNDERSLTIDRGARPEFTRDARYLIALVEPTEEAVDAAREKKRRDNAQPHDSLVVIDLSDLSVTRMADVDSFRLSEDDGSWVAYLLEPDDDEDEDRGRGRRRRPGRN